jgi:nucleotide-binding universal stress UspA family protein
MLPFRKILFPVDFSDRCRAISPIVRQTVEKFNADLVLLHAFDVLPLVLQPVEPSFAMPLPNFIEIRRRDEERLRQFTIEMFQGMKPTLLVEDGEPGRVVRDAIRHQGADLVMLPTYGHGAFRRFLLGSATAKILHDVDCAIWTDVHHAETQPTFPYRHVLCALDVNSEEASAVLRAGCSIAGTYDANLMLLHVVEAPPATWEVDYAEYREALLNRADEKMRQLRHETGIRAPYEIVGARRPADELRRIAIERQADLIITGRGHAQDGLGRVLSQLYPIIREAPCPVLSI